MGRPSNERWSFDRSALTPARTVAARSIASRPSLPRGVCRSSSPQSASPCDVPFHSRALDPKNALERASASSSARSRFHTAAPFPKRPTVAESEPNHHQIRPPSEDSPSPQPAARDLILGVSILAATGATAKIRYMCLQGRIQVLPWGCTGPRVKSVFFVKMFFSTMGATLKNGIFTAGYHRAPLSVDL